MMLFIRIIVLHKSEVVAADSFPLFPQRLFLATDSRELATHTPKPFRLLVKPIITFSAASFRRVPFRRLQYCSSPASCLEDHSSVCNGVLAALAAHPNPEVSCFTEKGFSQITSPRAGTELHAFCLRHLILASPFLYNTLVAFYSRFGRTRSAIRVFDQMPLRNAASWNTVIAACVRARLFAMAWDLFLEMLNEGIRLKGFVLASVMSGCDRSGEMLDEGLQVHGMAVKSAFAGDVYVGTSLVHFYGSYGLVPDAQSAFEEIHDKNVVSWTAFMLSYYSNSCGEEAILAYLKMRREQIECNQNSYATVISSCRLMQDERFGLQVITHVIVSGYQFEVSVGNSLIALFSDSGKLDYAEYVFRRLTKRDTISWNSMISLYSRYGKTEDVLGYFAEMRLSGVEPDSSTISSLVSSFNSVDSRKLGSGCHGLVVKSGLDVFLSVTNSLINMYTLCGMYGDAEILFHQIPDKDLICWNSMISCYVNSGKYMCALELLAKLLHSNLEINHITFANVLAACESPETLSDGKAIHAVMIRYGLQGSVFMGNALVTMYSNCHAIVEAKRVFHVMASRDIVSWNTLIGGYAEDQDRQEAVKAFNLMRHGNCKANNITLMNMLGACSHQRDLHEVGRALHAHIISTGFEFDGFLKNTILAMYARCGDFESTQLIFDKQAQKSVVSCNAVIAAKAHLGKGEEALKLFRTMHSICLELDQFSISGALAACAQLASLEDGQQIHSLMVKLCFELDLLVNNAAMDMYGKCGMMDDVLKLLPEVCDRSRQAWNILISVYARHGSFQKAKETFEEMLERGPKPDHVTFISLLSSCNHAGLVHEGMNYFSLMRSKFGISPTIEHCVCMVDILGRSGRLAEAEKFVEDMQVQPTDTIWRSLLASARIQGNLDVGQRAAERLLELVPKDDSAYVLLSNVFAASKRWEDVEYIRSHMTSVKLQKRPACSWIKVKNKVSSFGIGDQTHPQSEQIHEKLRDILHMVKLVGYVADTNFVLHDTDDEQKEHNLWNHSEKLALAYGLMSLPDSFSIRIFKNLRVCGDCHLVFKLVSSVIDREIVLRDPYRFHHFRGGKCSCSDYW